TTDPTPCHDVCTSATVNVTSTPDPTPTDPEPDPTPGDAAPEPGVPDSSARPADDGALALTGARTAGIATAALAVLGAGTAVVWATRRRRQ
ncbi:hypothetical protein ACIQMR_36930, partial [Streptomyces sp. NPDC091376]